MLLSNIEIENDFAKIYNKGYNYTLNFIHKFIVKYAQNSKKEFERMIIEDNIITMDTTETYKKAEAQFEKLYKPGSVKTLQFIEKNIKTLPEDVLSEIFEIINKNHENYTIKKSEVLINLGDLNETTVKEIVKFILFIRNSMEQLEGIFDKMDTFKTMFSETDVVTGPTINADPNYNPIIPDYENGPAPIIEKNSA